MRVLVLGADGMLGHEIVKQFRTRYEVVASVRRAPNSVVQEALDGADVRMGFDAQHSDRLRAFVEGIAPDVVLNCLGVVKQRGSAQDMRKLISVNAAFPHELSAVAQSMGVKTIHMSTDCVFSGKSGRYSESDAPDPLDAYGMSKLLGELPAPDLTIRTSMVGLELHRCTGLVEWFLRQTGDVDGFTGAIFSGLTTMELARCLDLIVNERLSLEGVWHVSSSPIDKYSLLSHLSHALGRTDVHVEPRDDVVCDRSLDSSRFSAITGYVSPSWQEMLAELASRIEVRARAAGS